VVRPTAGDARDQALGRNVKGKKWGGRKVYGWGKKNGLLRAGWERQKRGKENKTKQKKKLAGCSWLGGEKEEREREREKKKKKKKKGLLLRTWLGGKKKKKRPAAYQLAGWEKEKREREKKKKKRPAVHVAGWEKEKGGTEKKNKIKIHW
jgi:hypothetical protein